MPLVAPCYTRPAVHRKDAPEGTPTDDHQFQSVKDEVLQGKPDFIDGLGPLFDLYLKMAVEEGRNMVDGWKADAYTTLVFSGLFSVVVAAFLIVSLQDLRPDSQDKPTFYLENIYQLLADPNRTHVPTSYTQSNLPTFSPPRSVVWVNSLWSLSLVITVSCALLAILVQQWARRYVKLTQQRSSSCPHKRALVRAFFDKGVEDLRLQWAVDALPILLHTSLVLFLAGFIIFSFGYNHTVLKVVVSWVGLCAVVYACFTFLPLIRHNSPYYTPLSPLLWLIYTGTLYVALQILWWCTAFNCFSEETWDRFGHLKDHYGRRFFHRIEEVAEESAQKSPSEVNGRILLWALQSLDEDQDVRQFFESIPDFHNSKVLDEFRAAFKTSDGEKMADALIELMNRTLSSDLITKSTKYDWIKNYFAAMAGLSLPINRRTLTRVLHRDWGALLNLVEFGILLRNARYSDPFAEYYSQCVVSNIIARVKVHDNRWFELATGHLGISMTTLESYLAHGDSVLLANCIFICRRTFDAYTEHRWHRDVYSRSKTLDLVSRFDVQNTLPNLRHEYCDMWNEFVRNAGDRRSRNLSIYILKHIRNVYFELHRDTDAIPTAFTYKTPDDDLVFLFPTSYPSCMIGRHHPYPGSAKVDYDCVESSEVRLSTITAWYSDSILTPFTKEPPPNDAPPVLQGWTPVATAAVIPTDGASQCPPPGLPSPKRFSVRQGDARTHATLFGPSVTLHSTYTTPSPLSIPLSRICDHPTKAASNASDVTPGATARAVHTPSKTPCFVSHPAAVLEAVTPLAAHNASSKLTPNTGRTGTISASMQSVAEVYAVSPQPIPIAPPACAVVRASHVKDDPRSTGPLADMTVGTALAFASSKASPVFDTSCEVSTTPHLPTSTSSSTGGVASRDSTHAVPDTPSPSLPISVPGNTISTYTHSFTISSMSRTDHTPSWTGSLARNDSTVLPQQASLVPATTPEFSQPLRGTRPSPQDTDRSGRSRSSTTRYPTVAS